MKKQKQIREIIERFLAAREKRNEAMAEEQQCRLEMRRLLGEGSHGGVTVYRVKETFVPSYTRRPHTATRVSTKK